MRTPIKWAELHSPIFVAGTNLQQKLDPKKRKGLHIEYDEDSRHLYVTYNGQTARVPEPSILSMIEGEAEVVQASKGLVTVTEVEAKRGPGRPIKAQASGPHDHVFAGPGGGKVRI